MDGRELFELGVRERPQEAAIFYFEQEIGFRAAAERAWGLAAALTGELGLRPGDRIALMAQNDPAVPIAVHAAWHSGLIVTTVNPMSKERETHHQLLDSGARAVICLEQLHPTVAAAVEGTAVEHVLTVPGPAQASATPPGALDFELLAVPAEPPEPARSSPPSQPSSLTPRARPGPRRGR